jgi:hypothetical protein
MTTSSDEQVSADVAYLIQEYDAKKDNVTMMTITYGDHKVVREIALDQHKTHAHPTVEIDTLSNEVYYTLVNPNIFFNISVL